MSMEDFMNNNKDFMDTNPSNLKESSIVFTTGQFAKLHNINKRTLHYYDEIGILSPVYVGENGYRYYTYLQSLQLENILALREIDMSIEEIKKYLSNPNSEDFIRLAGEKINNIDETIKKLKGLKKVLQNKCEHVILSEEIYHGKIEVINCKEEYLSLTQLDFQHYEVENLIQHLKSAWEHTSYKKGCGSFISVEKLKNKQYNDYDGLFTEIDKPTSKKGLFLRPKGKYLRSFCKGDWNGLAEIHENMFKYAEENNLKLSGYCYEMGLNEATISTIEEYVTQVMIMCEEKST